MIKFPGIQLSMSEIEDGSSLEIMMGAIAAMVRAGAPSVAVGDYAEAAAAMINQRDLHGLLTVTQDTVLVTS